MNTLLYTASNFAFIACFAINASAFFKIIENEALSLTTL